MTNLMFPELHDLSDVHGWDGKMYEPHKPTVREIVAVVSEEAGFTQEQLIGYCRTRKCAQARQMTYALACRYSGENIGRVAQLLNRDAATVRAGCDVHENNTHYYPDILKLTLRVEAALGVRN